MTNYIPPFSQHPLVKGSILETIGKTPLIPISFFSKEYGKNMKLYGKLEASNPGGSVKDRPALQMILDGIESKQLVKGKIVIDSTSGNTGIGLAMVCSIIGYPIELCVPQNASSERKSRLNAYGAKIYFTDPLEGSDGALRYCAKLYEENPQKYFKPDQYSSPSNPKAHFLSTGPEIWEQTKGKITHFIASIGTTGTIMGNTRFFKSKNASIQCFGAEPDDPLHGLEGLKHMDSSLVPSLYQKDILDGVISIDTYKSYDMARKLAYEEGLFVGQSSGGAVLAACQLAKKLVEEGTKEANIVVILPDSGDRYISKGLWEDK